MWALARRERLIDARCPLHEAQQFLERQIPEEGALETVGLLKKFAWAEMGPAVRRREVQRIRSVPPDRTSRNMLQLVGRLATPEAALEAADEPTPGPAETEFIPGDEGVPAAEQAPAPPRRSRAPARPAPRPNRARASKTPPRPRKSGAASRPHTVTGKPRERPRRSVAKSSKTGSG
jgi:hypothetical protein